MAKKRVDKEQPKQDILLKYLQAIKKDYALFFLGSFVHNENPKEKTFCERAVDRFDEEFVFIRKLRDDTPLFNAYEDAVANKMKKSDFYRMYKPLKRKEVLAELESDASYLIEEIMLYEEKYVDE